MSIEWTRLRPLDGSQPTAFEELCCQLAAHEPVPTGSAFTRVGAPDAGVECYWTLPNGDELGWQAKFFTTVPGPGQWQQVNDSIRTALAKHPRLTAYTICMPLNRQDPRRAGEQWFMDKWDERVGAWQKIAQDASMYVEFRYWGESEIWDRLSSEQHKGRHLFWFNQELFSDEWFKSRLDEAIANAGPRYTPEINIELPIAQLFEGLGRTQRFFDTLEGHFRTVELTYEEWSASSARRANVAEYDELDRDMAQLMHRPWPGASSESRLDWDGLAEDASHALRAAEECVDLLKRKMRQGVEAEPETQARAQQDASRLAVDDLKRLIERLSELADFARGDCARLTNVPGLLVLGEAGSGKTHLLRGIAEQRLASRHPTCLLLGRHFEDREPWKQIIEHLRLGCSPDEFLGALSAAAEVRGVRLLLMIDALNEGNGRYLWRKYLAGMLTVLARYPRLGIVLSARTTYQSLVVPSAFNTDQLISVTHTGFAEHEFQATAAFFEYYGIELPSVPLLTPEFQNPLFLTLFCQGLEVSGYRGKPEGLHGITRVFGFFIDNVNKQLADPERLDYDHRQNKVRLAVNSLASEMTNGCHRWLPLEVARDLVDRHLPGRQYMNSLYKGMIIEGVLVEDRFRVLNARDEGYEYAEGVSFAYERLWDHLLVRCLLDAHLNRETPLSSFSPDQPLGKLLADEVACFRYAGLIEALAIQVPEQVGVEIGELAPHAADYEPVRRAFVESLLWRDPSSITERTWEHACQHALRHPRTFEGFLGVLLTISLRPDHPYNADFLHSKLMPLDMAERDVWWSRYLHDQFSNGVIGPVTRLVDWAWMADRVGLADDATVMLAGITLGWFLTTSNRILRDRTTKALVRLLSDRFSVLCSLLNAFARVNDPYVSERLYAVAYGCAMRSDDSKAVGDLALDVYQHVFAAGTPHPDALLRDHARGIIERALEIGAQINVQAETIHPPYHSAWSDDIPSMESLENLREHREGMMDSEWARVELYDSVMGFGDFARYIIGTNLHDSRWSSTRIGEPEQPSPKQEYEQFKASLTAKQLASLERYELLRNRDVVKQLLAKYSERTGQKPTSEDIDQAIQGLEGRFRKLLGKHKGAIFDQHVLPYLQGTRRSNDEFELALIQRFILNRVIELGWTVKRFGEFDRRISRQADIRRDEDKPERIGKKYQWIAYYEILARLSDHFQYKGYSWEERTGAYQGPWQIRNVRNIDPSFLLEATAGNRQEATQPWWFSIIAPSWDEGTTDLAWLADPALPDIRNLLTVVQPTAVPTRWLTLHGFYRWTQPIPRAQRREGLQGRQIWCAIDSYLVRQSDLDMMLDWARNQNFIQNRVPEPVALDDVYIGEYHWAPAYTSQYERGRGYVEWTHGVFDSLPIPICLTTEKYAWSRGYDCSIQESIQAFLPTKYLADLLEVRWQSRSLGFVNPAADMIAFDPSMANAGPPALLIRDDAVQQLLQDNDLALWWVVRGEKNAYGMDGQRDRYLTPLGFSGSYSVTGSGEIGGTLHVAAGR